MTSRWAPDPDDPATALMHRLAGKWITQALCAAAELGLAEALAEPADLEALARAVHCEPGSLLRLLRVLVGEGALVEQPDGRYALTPMGAQLRADALGPLARFVGSPSQWTPWTELTHAVRTGQSAFERVHGQPLFDYLAAHPQEARLYDEAVDAFTSQQARALAALPVLDGVQTLVDVGGGRGTLLAELLRQRPALRGVLFDRPHVVAAARARFEAQALHERCTFVAGDFFESVPPGGDVYVVKHVLHNWDDDRAVTLLRRCAQALPEGGRVFVVEAILLPGNRRDGARMFDLEMLVLTGGGRERSKPEFRRLLSQAGLRLGTTQRLSDGAW
ncbi:MAG: methyltransferase domain-containing protein, partial [Myxococcales bacterium]|nr:methyltransferase domain-containing protein [Myxococcales bacterium]